MLSVLLIDSITWILRFAKLRAIENTKLSLRHLLVQTLEITFVYSNDVKLRRSYVTQTLHIGDKFFFLSAHLFGSYIL